MRSSRSCPSPVPPLASRQVADSPLRFGTKVRRTGSSLLLGRSGSSGCLTSTRRHRLLLCHPVASRCIEWSLRSCTGPLPVLRRKASRLGGSRLELLEFPPELVPLALDHCQPTLLRWRRRLRRCRCGHVSCRLFLLKRRQLADKGRRKMDQSTLVVDDRARGEERTGDAPCVGGPRPDVRARRATFLISR